MNCNYPQLSSKLLTIHHFYPKVKRSCQGNIIITVTTEMKSNDLMHRFPSETHTTTKQTLENSGNVQHNSSKKKRKKSGQMDGHYLIASDSIWFCCLFDDVWVAQGASRWLDHVWCLKELCVRQIRKRTLTPSSHGIRIRDDWWWPKENVTCCMMNILKYWTNVTHFWNLRMTSLWCVIHVHPAWWLVVVNSKTWCPNIRKWTEQKMGTTGKRWAHLRQLGDHSVMWWWSSSSSSFIKSSVIYNLS